MKACRHYFVSGQVQGVFFRASTQLKAKELGLSGWVRNRVDGRVELVACGQEESLQALQNWLWQGPRHAQVGNVEILDSIEKNHVDFLIR